MNLHGRYGRKIDNYYTVVNSETDYYPFGMIMPGRSNSATSGYRFGFNGKEKNNEIEGEGNSYDFGARIYDIRLGRWLTMDTRFIKYPAFSPYHYGYCSPLTTIDPDGRENIVILGNANIGDAVTKGHDYSVTSANMYMVGVNLAKSYATKNTEGTTLIIYKGQYTESDIKSIQQQLQSSHVQIKVVNNTKDAMNYVNNKNGSDRKDDKISNLGYVGHASSGTLLVSFLDHKTLNGKETMINDFVTAKNFNTDIFKDNANIDLLGCNTGKGSGNIAWSLFGKLGMGGKVTAAPGSVYFGMNGGQDKSPAPGKYYFQSSDDANHSMAPVPPTVYERESIKPMETKQPSSIKNN